MTALRRSAATFGRGTSYKLLFVALVYMDLLLTVFALERGFIELNPYMLHLLSNPPELLMVKIATPLVIAWLVPAPLLAPAAGFMVFVSGWNLLQLFAIL